MTKRPEKTHWDVCAPRMHVCDYAHFFSSPPSLRGISPSPDASFNYKIAPFFFLPPLLFSNDDHPQSDPLLSSQTNNHLSPRLNVLPSFLPLTFTNAPPPSHSSCPISLSLCRTERESVFFVSWRDIKTRATVEAVLKLEQKNIDRGDEEKKKEEQIMHFRYFFLLNVEKNCSQINRPEKKKIERQGFFFQRRISGRMDWF